MTATTARLNATYSAQVDLALIKEMVRSELLAILSQARALSLALPAECRSLLMDDLSAQIHPDGRNDNITESFGRAESWCDAEVDEFGPRAELPASPSAPV